MADERAAGAPPFRADAASLDALVPVARLAARLLDTDAAAILLAGAAPRAITRAGAADDALEAAGRRFSERVLARGAAIAIGDARAEDAVVAGPEGSAVSLAGVPLRAGDGTSVGSLAVLGRAPRRWSDADLGLLDELAAFAARDLEHHAAAAPLERRTQELRLLSEAAHALAGPLTREEVAERSLAGASEVVTPSTTLAVVEYDGTSFRTLAARGPDADRFRGETHTVETLPGPVRSQLVDALTPLVVPDLAAAGPATAQLVARFGALAGARSLAIVPLVSRDRAVAALVARSPDAGALTEDRVRLLTTHGVFFAGALHNAQLVAEANERAATLAGQAALLDLSSDAIFVRDIDGTILFWSRGASEMLGWTAEEAVGQSSLEMLRPIYPRPRDALHEELRRTGRWTGEVVYHHRDGHRIDVILRWVLREAWGDHPETVLVTATDIGERKRVERMKEEFVAIVSHELRTPLTAMRGALGLLAGGAVGELPADARPLVEIANSNAERLGRLVNDMLDLQRWESGKMPLVPGDVDLSDLVQRVVSVMRPLADRAGVRLAADVPRLVIRADRDRVEQLLMNLVANAIKFSPKGGTVSVRIEEREATVRIAVSDEGRGIPADQLERVFERFAQVDASDARQKGGTGLGLAISRAIAEQHGGRIWVESALGAGSTFYIELPHAVTRA